MKYVKPLTHSNSVAQFCGLLKTEQQHKNKDCFQAGFPKHFPSAIDHTNE